MLLWIFPHLRTDITDYLRCELSLVLSWPISNTHATWLPIVTSFGWDKTSSQMRSHRRQDKTVLSPIYWKLSATVANSVHTVRQYSLVLSVFAVWTSHSILSCLVVYMHPQQQAAEALCFSSSVSQSVNIFFAYCDISVLSGGISMTPATNIYHVSGHRWKGFQGQRSEVKVITRPMTVSYTHLTLPTKRIV